jgi:hypothetical protein
MSDHDERMKGLGRDHFFVPDAQFLVKKGIHPFQTDSRHERRKLNKQTKQRVSRLRPVLKALADGGAGFPIDQMIRAYAAEYNNRSLTHGTQVLPTSFNILEAFLAPEKFEGIIPIFLLRDERDHMFSLSDFFDYLTSKDGPKNPVAEALRLPEGIIHSYTPTGSLEELTFLYGESTPFAVAGFSFIRYGPEINWLLLGGPRLDEEELSLASKEIRDWDTGAAHPSKEFLISDYKPEGTDPPVILEGTEGVWKTVIFGRLDVETGKHLVRYRAREREKSFEIVTDDPAVFYDEAGAEEHVRNALDVFDEEGVLFNIAEGLCALPAYFAFKITLVREVSKETRLFSTRPSGGRKPPSTYGKRFRKVAALEIVNPSTPPALRRYQPPQYQVEVEGFWRRLQDDAMGRGFHGEPVRGRTWVRSHLRWRDRPPRAKTIYVKSSVSAAKARAAALAISKPTLQPVDVPLQFEPPPETTDVTAGYLYVMRCPLMEGDIYKVGFTAKTPRERAEELSRATGVPYAFVVVHSWHHENAREVERVAHAALADRRLPSRREFFKAPFDELREIIDRAITQYSPIRI